jgi:hypothetical protein
MSEPRRIELGFLPSGGATVFVGDGAVDPIKVLIAEGNAKLDREHAEAERARLAEIADAERMRNTRRARLARRLGKALKVLRFMR